MLELLVGTFFIIVLVGLAFFVTYFVIAFLPDAYDNIRTLRKKIREAKNERV